MKKHTFETYNDYVESQVAVTRKKVKRGIRYNCTREKVIEAVANYHRSRWPFSFGVCHGVRLGTELDLFEHHMPGKWIGTEICPDLCDGERVINQDFSYIPDGWAAAIDLIYSNSLDHARNPVATLARWISCLAPTGRMYLEWNRYHNRLGRGQNKADCFAATEKEYRDMCESVGFVESVLSAKGKMLLKVFVVKRR